MTITYKSTPSITPGIGPTAVYGPVPVGTQAIVLGMTLCNVLTDPVAVTVTAAAARIVFQQVIPPGTTLVVIGKDERVVIEAGESITLVNSIAGGVDSLVSTLEIS